MSQLREVFVLRVEQRTAQRDELELLELLGPLRGGEARGMLSSASLELLL